MSDLTTFRDHCRAMTKPNAHRPDCPGHNPHRPWLKPAGCEGCVSMLAAEIDDYLDPDQADHQQEGLL
jgi:hypothetical protein